MVLICLLILKILYLFRIIELVYIFEIKSIYNKIKTIIIERIKISFQIIIVFVNMQQINVNNTEKVPCNNLP